MARPKKADTSTGSFFEEDYLVRTLGRIAHDPEVALTELVANAWDAGASLVDITVPSVRETALVVQDDGHGMSAAQFRDRWMRLGYDRIKHQGVQVEFPTERADWRRKAYGRNGVGRHGLHATRAPGALRGPCWPPALRTRKTPEPENQIPGRGPFHSVREGGLELISTPSRRESRYDVLPHKVNDLQHVNCG